MKRTTKSWLAVLLTVLLLFGTVAFGFSAAAEEETPTVVASGDCGAHAPGMSWTYDSNDTLTISGEGGLPCYDPEEGFTNYNDPHETYVPWYPYNMSMKTLVLEEGINQISVHNFCGCPNLKSVVLPTSLQLVVEVAFYRSSAIRDVFYAGDAAQWNSIYFADIGGPGDTGNEELLNANIHYNVVDWGYCGGEGDSTNLTWTFTSDGTLIISGTGAMADYRPLSSYGPGETPWVQYRLNIKHLVVQAGVTYIGKNAFCNCHELEDALLPDGLTAIGPYAFSGCTILSEIDLPDSLTTIGDSAFSCCGLTEITIPDSVTELESDAFAWCSSLAQVQLGRGLSNLSGGLFDGCSSLESIVIPDNITGDCAAAFTYCTNLKNVTLSDNMEGIGAYMFRYCAIESIDLPASVKYIDHAAFEGCANMKSFTIPEGIPSIKQETFYKCSGLETITIPQSVKSIESSAFDGCDNLKDVYYGGSARQWNLLPLGNNNDDELQNCTIHFADTEDDLVWSIEKGVLTVNGEGPIIPTLGDVTDRHWDAETQTWVTSTYHSIQTTFPWSVTGPSFPEYDEEGNLIIGDYDQRVKTIIIGEGITEIYDSAFTNYAPATIILPSTLERIPRQFAHPHRPYATLVSYSAFNTSSLKDLYILNPDADMSDFSIKIRTRTPGAADYADDFNALYMEYVKAMLSEELGYMAAALTGYTGESVLFKYYAAKHGAAVYDFYYRSNGAEREDLDVRPEGVDAYIAGLLENDQEVWEYLGIPYDDTEAFEAAMVAYVNRSLGTDFASIDDMYVLQDPITEGGKPEAANSEALAAAVEAEGARLLAIQAEYGFIPDGSADTETEPQGEYYLGDPPEMEKDGETIALTPPQDLCVHGYEGSTAEAAAAASGVRFVPITANGTCGEHLTWVLENNTLTVSGTGAMADYSDSEPAPWAEYFAVPGAEITVLLEEGVTKIGANAFPASEGLKELIVLNRACDLSALAIREPAFLRGYRPSTAENYANAHEDDCLFMPLCDVDYHHAVVWKVEWNNAEDPDEHTHGVFCTVCDDYLYSHSGHEWSEWETVKEPTVEAEGEETRTCSVCEKTETRTVEKLQPEDNGNNKDDGGGGFLLKALTAIVRWFKKLLSFFSK